MIRINSKIGDYGLTFVDTKSFLDKIDNEYPQARYVIDKKVWNLYRRGFFDDFDKKRVTLLEINEKVKSLKTVQSIYDTLVSSSLKRNLVLVSIGGGITQDISGFLASTLYRGIRWIFIPTTLLAQSDSCIGSKTSLNYGDYKNLIGTFYPPHKVNIDIRFIGTQDNNDFYSGLGEIVKLHIIGGKSYADYIIDKLPIIIERGEGGLLKAIKNSLLIKKNYIEKDEFDRGIRNLLNYGHCFGHAIESATNFKVSHGQAVVLGMILANIVAQKRGLLSQDFAERLMGAALMPLIPHQRTRYYLLIHKIIAAMRKDKKRTGAKLALIALKDGYKLTKIDDLTDSEAGNAVKKMDNLLQYRGK